MNKIKIQDIIVRSFLLGSLFLFAYVPAYFIAGTSYSLISPIPADHSRSVSWIYYGFIFCLIPYTVTGLMLNGMCKRATWKDFVHAVIVTTVADKLLIVLLATLLAQGFPQSWYGWGFPYAGYNLMCEELPFYCRSYITEYHIADTILGAAFICLGYWIGGIVKHRVSHV
ncbi:hypothetical protein [Paenibacillus sp. OAS669]|uniref:hypothetical protein n=1 Tax=Paenibacillus sp. OAS669 TaxID=2663821 RepID=UPI00178B04EF|nr:hypothetical protein [Paenibacillus sp. OAS669]MBE1441736.1 hypothetical protein [Paenibacillus sp. OAS669]